MVMEAIWNQVLHWCGHDEYTVTVIVPNILIVTTFWITSGLYMIVDLTCRPEKLLLYKTQLGENQPVDGGRLWKAVRLSLFNHVFVQLPCLMGLFHYLRWRGYGWQTSDLPSLGDMLLNYHIWVWCSDAVFYYGHRLLHWGPLYKPIHKMHHSWTAPVAVTAHYVHPIEFLISNQLVLYMGTMVTGCHMLTFYIWIVYGVFETCGHHSGYHLPLLSPPEFHDFHHKTFNSNYGGAFFDKLHGTFEPYKDSMDKKRDFKFYSWGPVRNLVPDVKESKPKES